MVNTFVATAAAGLSWMIVEFIFRWKMSLLGLVSGVVAGLVAVTPAAGFVGPMGAAILGAVAGVVCLFFCTAIKWLLQVRRQPGRVRHPLHRRHRRRARHRPAGQPRVRRHRHPRLRRQPRRGEGGRVRARRAADCPGQGRGSDAAVVGHRLGHHLQDRGYRSSAPASIRRASRPASICRSTASAATSTSTEPRTPRRHERRAHSTTPPHRMPAELPPRASVFCGSLGHAASFPRARACALFLGASTALSWRQSQPTPIGAQTS